MQHEKGIPCKQTEKIIILEKNQEFMKVTISNVDDKVDKLTAKVDLMIDKLDHRYASKRTEQAMRRIIGLVMTGVVGALLALVIK